MGCCNYLMVKYYLFQIIYLLIELMSWGHMKLLTKIKNIFYFYKLRKIVYKHCEYVTDEDIKNIAEKMVKSNSKTDDKGLDAAAKLIVIEALARSGLSGEVQKLRNCSSGTGLNTSIKNDITSKQPQDEILPYAPKPYLNDIIISEFGTLDIFKPSHVDLIISQIKEIKYPSNLRKQEPLLSTEDKKRLNIKYRGKLSTIFYDAILDKDNIRSVIQQYEDFIEKCARREYDLQYVDRRILHNKIALHNRKRSISLGFTQGVWHNAPNGIPSTCNHKHLDEKVFSLVNGVYNELTNSADFPDEQISCLCFYTIDFEANY